MTALQPSDVLTSFDVAVWLNIRLRAVWDLVRVGKLHPFIVAPGGYRFTGSDVLAYQEGQQT